MPSEHAVIPPMRAYLEAIYAPFCQGATGWAKENEVEGLISITPLYQFLGLLRKQGQQGDRPHKQIQSMLCALAQLERLKPDCAAAMNPKLPKR